VALRVVVAVLAAGLLGLGGCAVGSSPAPTGRPGLSPVPAPADRAPVPASEPGYRPATGVPTVVSHGPSSGRRIALTFDSNMTEAMLRRLDAHQVDSYANPAVVDELQARDAPATFFLSGLWVQRYPELTRRIADNPRFELASHSNAHRGFTASCYTLDPLPADQMAADVERSFAVLAPFGGRQTRYFRFPGGCYDRAALRALAGTHTTVIQYDDVGDDPFNDDAAGITATVLAQAHAGAIVVLHITKGNAPRTADALPGVIDGLRARGYHLVTLSELLTATH
jgi:peptidoglycan/xylan/chitin deacetylase (PgdA/CDA1 family)